MDCDGLPEGCQPHLGVAYAEVLEDGGIYADLECGRCGTKWPVSGAGPDPDTHPGKAFGRVVPEAPRIKLGRGV